MNDQKELLTSIFNFISKNGIAAFQKVASLLSNTFHFDLNSILLGGLEKGIKSISKGGVNILEYITSFGGNIEDFLTEAYKSIENDTFELCSLNIGKIVGLKINSLYFTKHQDSQTCLITSSIQKGNLRVLKNSSGKLVYFDDRKLERVVKIYSDGLMQSIVQESCLLGIGTKENPYYFTDETHQIAVANNTWEIVRDSSTNTSVMYLPSLDSNLENLPTLEELNALSLTKEMRLARQNQIIKKV